MSCYFPVHLITGQREHYTRRLATGECAFVTGQSFSISRTHSGNKYTSLKKIFSGLQKKSNQNFKRNESFNPYFTLFTRELSS